VLILIQASSTDRFWT